MVSDNGVSSIYIIKFLRPTHFWKTSTNSSWSLAYNHFSIEDKCKYPSTNIIRKVLHCNRPVFTAYFSFNPCSWFRAFLHSFLLYLLFEHITNELSHLMLCARCKTYKQHKIENKTINQFCFISFFHFNFNS